MIKNWIVTGDTHGGMSTITRIGNINRNMNCIPEESAVIILGDAGLNFFLNGTDKKYKKTLNDMGYHIYCVRGNHEERPENIPGMILIEDENVNNAVWMQEEFPNIRYFVDGNEYNIGDHSTLVIGGAYSIDKWYRLARAGYTSAEAETANPKKCGWFKDELLTKEEMDAITLKATDKRYEFVLSHTCPMSWEPTDLFLRGIDQAQVDKSMEIWMDELKEHMSWGVWCFGHFHADRIERPHVEQFYNEYETIDTISERWKKYDETGELDWWLPKSPTMQWTLHANQMNNNSI
jgi:3-oxoacid CoA-transferase subunit A